MKSAAILLALGIAALGLSQERQVIDVQVTGHVYKPAKAAASDDRVNSLKAPAGFRIQKFAEGLGKPRMIAVHTDGTVYVTRRDPGDCLMLRDTDGDGRADLQKTVASKEGLHGITIRDGKVYFATVKEIYTADIGQDGALGELKRIVSDLPDGGQHPNRTLAFGPDGMLYVSIGSSCNACAETNREHATMLRFRPEGTGREVFARGLRNTIGFGWHPETRQMWGMDHGVDWLGDQEQKEELNGLEQSKHYGWPWVYADGKINPAEENPPGTTKEQFAQTAEKPVLLYTAHAAPMQMVFYTGSQFPADYRNDAFVAMRGSWNAKPPTGYEIVRIRFQNGKPASIEPFLTGFLVEQGGAYAQFGRPVGIAMMRDGSLVFSDDDNGVIYRVSYRPEVSDR